MVLFSDHSILYAFVLYAGKGYEIQLLLLLLLLGAMDVLVLCLSKFYLSFLFSNCNIKLLAELNIEMVIL